MTTHSWQDFNDAEPQMTYEPIPRDTLVRVELTFRPGGYNDVDLGWSHELATKHADTGSIYLVAIMIVANGEYVRRYVRYNIGLHSTKNKVWSEMGRTFIRAALNSARNIMPSDNSPTAKTARRITSLAELVGLELLIQVGIEVDNLGVERNYVKLIIEPDHPSYSLLMSATKAPVTSTAKAPASAVESVTEEVSE